MSLKLAAFGSDPIGVLVAELIDSAVKNEE